ncbi:hypothetical protein F400_gp017 [Bacillus phage BCD7]|uniref:Uncharacterized protein n=1 Tax=Bacillus phage BCD7 TaxID=1136534 RepID=J9PV57_9CAUD|nr:hypothetical protein F400_gp017 [Bacillus phage BCD7]AEZ50464.1 hypothetical protein BCD7_0017 [Bacillus phage BCD7]
MGRIRQFFCTHDYKHIADHNCSQQNLWQCKKCKLYYIQHYGIGIGYSCRVPNIGGWIKPKWRD